MLRGGRGCGGAGEGVRDVVDVERRMFGGGRWGMKKMEKRVEGWKWSSSSDKGYWGVKERVKGWKKCGGM